MFTKAQIAKLPVEQQEMLAQIELSKTRRREQLLEKARGLDWRSRYWPLYPFAIFMIFVALYYFNSFHLQEKPSVLYLIVGMMFVNGLIFHITRTNRRLDALVELLDFDHKNQGDSNNSKDA
ncbi:MAG TPA: hypothetical protein VE344_05845 [Methylomirabilota bacterium]|nr:hypothetical protein [Methylomirabilota bacterium]